MRSSYEAVSGAVMHMTDKAILLRIDGQFQKTADGERVPRELWVPRSVIEDGDSIKPDDMDFHVRSWFAEQEDL